MGSIDKDAYEAERKLRPQCAQGPNYQKLAELYCKTYPEAHKTSLDKNLLGHIANALTHDYFKNYTSDVLLSELELSSTMAAKAPQCLELPNPRVKPHIRSRNSAQSKINLVSAGILSEIYDGYILGVGSHEPYLKRLRESFPMLFHSPEKKDELIETIEQALGDDFKVSNKDGRSHSSIKQAYESLYDKSKSFRKKIDRKVDEMSRSYAQFLSDELKQLCNGDPIDIQKTHPGIFKQAILDMDQTQREVANHYLCSKSQYYNPEEHDSDCDGLVDSEDPTPNDPFSPKNDFSHSGADMTDPPFASRYDYEVNYNKKNKNIQLETTLKLDISKLPSGKKTNEFIQKINTCKNELEKSISQQFDSLKKNSNTFDQKANLKTAINIDYGDFFFPDMKLHKCFCSDCKNAVVDPDNPGLVFTNYIDHTTCWDDLTANQKRAVQKKFQDAKDRWRDRDNAANLTQNTSCKTIKHELLHRFGLPDEYIDDFSYPFNKVGCNIMGIGFTEEIESRQIEAILRPRECR